MDRRVLQTMDIANAFALSVKLPGGVVCAAQPRTKGLFDFDSRFADGDIAGSEELEFARRVADALERRSKGRNFHCHSCFVWCRVSQPQRNWTPC